MNRITQSDKNRLSWNQGRFFEGVLDTRTGPVLETVTFEEGEAARWKHYLSPRTQRALERGWAKTFRLEDGRPRIDWKNDASIPTMDRLLQETVGIAAVEQLAVDGTDYIQVPDDYDIHSMAPGQLYIAERDDAQAHHTVSFHRDGYFFASLAWENPDGTLRFAQEPGELQVYLGREMDRVLNFGMAREYGIMVEQLQEHRATAVNTDDPFPVFMNTMHQRLEEWRQEHTGWPQSQAL